MLEGMTGFSQIQSALKEIRISLDLRSYNHRYLDVVVNLPNGFSIFEDNMRQMLKDNFTRGRLTLNLHVSALIDGEIVVNEHLLKEYIRHIRKMAKKFDLKSDFSLRDIVSLPGVIAVEKPVSSYKGYWPYLEKLLQKVVRQLKNTRALEGRGTLKDILVLLKSISRQTECIAINVKQIISQKKRELNQEDFSLYLKATDINEEIFRLREHLKSFERLLNNAQVKAKGKELDFIAQELQREANTIGAKCQAYKISASVVKIKSEIEKIREQLQNVQ